MLPQGDSRSLPPSVPAGAFGPRLGATDTALIGDDRLSKRQVRAELADLLGLDISVGMACKAERLAAEVVASTTARPRP